MMIGLDCIRDCIDQAMRPAHFFVGPALGLEWQHQPSEETSWEIFQGRLLDPAHTRQRRTFESWHLWQLDATGRSAAPLLSVKLDAAARQVHVVRAILTQGWEAFDAGGNVIDTRPAEKWVRELVGTIDLDAFHEAAALIVELACLLRQAVVGTSRLALTSLEAPLPAFALGQLAYFHQSNAAANSGPLRSDRDLLERALPAAASLPERARVLETMLRAGPDQSEAAWQACQVDRPAELLLAVFNDVSLSPYTDFVPRALRLAARFSPAHQADFLTKLLRRLARHLTAFDLVQFHHRGANYPDALLLDAALQLLAGLLERNPGLGEQRLTRRALRQAWLLRRHYEGQPVPDVPTSEGENVRILPAPFARVPAEQILDPSRRPRRLFADAPLDLGPEALRRLAQSMDDLEDPAELQELGTALCLDRPLGIFKRPGEPDRTPLLSYVAFSRMVAQRRLRTLQDLGVLTAARRDRLEELLKSLEVQGLALETQSLRPRPGAATLLDAGQVAGDFQLLRTTQRGLADFLAICDIAPLLHGFTPRLIVGGSVLPGERPDSLHVFDAELQPRLVFRFEAAMTCRGGREFPAGGLELIRRDGAEVAGPVVHSNPGKTG